MALRRNVNVKITLEDQISQGLRRITSESRRTTDGLTKINNHIRIISRSGKTVANVTADWAEEQRTLSRVLADSGKELRSWGRKIGFQGFILQFTIGRVNNTIMRFSKTIAQSLINTSSFDQEINNLDKSLTSLALAGDLTAEEQQRVIDNFNESTKTVIDFQSSMTQLQQRIIPLKNIFTQVATEGIDVFITKYDEMIEKAGGETAFFEDFRTASASFISPILDSFTKIMDAEDPGGALITIGEALGGYISGMIDTVSSLVVTLTDLSSGISDMNTNLDELTRIDFEDISESIKSITGIDISGLTKSIDELTGIDLSEFSIGLDDFTSKDLSKITIGISDLTNAVAKLTTTLVILGTAMSIIGGISSLTGLLTGVGGSILAKILGGGITGMTQSVLQNLVSGGTVPITTNTGQVLNMGIYQSGKNIGKVFFRDAAGKYAAAPESFSIGGEMATQISSTGLTGAEMATSLLTTGGTALGLLGAALIAGGPIMAYTEGLRNPEYLLEQQQSARTQQSAAWAAAQNVQIYTDVNIGNVSSELDLQKIYQSVWEAQADQAENLGFPPKT